jgi:hypothetical protein
MASPLWSDRQHDPHYLWPISAIAALSLHGVAGWWVMQARAVNRPSAPAVIELIAVPAPSLPETGNASPSVASSDGELNAEATPLTEAKPLADIAPLNPQTPPTATVPERVSPRATVAPQSPISPAPPVASQPSPTPVASPPTATGTTEAARQTVWTLRPLPGGRDLPDTLPQFPEGWQAPALFSSDFCLANQDWAGLGPLTVGLYLIVEANGQISQVQTLQPSGNIAYDNAVTCVLERLNLSLEPALTSGEPIASDVLLEVTRSSNQ